jgi:hypothetical protein
MPLYTDIYSFDDGVACCRYRWTGMWKSAGPGVYQVGLPLLRAGEQQGTAAGTASSRRQEKRGKQWLATKFALKHHKVEADLSPAACAAAIANRAFRQA